MVGFFLLGLLLVPLHIFITRRQKETEDAFWAAIKRDREAKDEARRTAAEVYALMAENLAKGKCFKPELIPELVAGLRDYSDKEGHHIYMGFDGEPLSLEEKKRLGLPTRKKIPSDVPQYLTEEGLKMDYAREMKWAFLNAESEVTRRQQLESITNRGSKWLRVIGCKTYGQGRFPVNEPPKVPCPGCSQNICRCIFWPADYD